MRILMLGDVVGEPGRRLVETHLPALRRETGAEFVIVNGENAAHGHGITEGIAKEWFTQFEVDVITTGNHAFDVKGIEAYLRQEPRLLRPANHPPDTAGNGWVKLHTRSGEEVLVINLMGRVHMPACDCPFRCVDTILQKERADLVIVDMHAEATAEKVAMGWYLDGKVSAVLGTHSHIQTADERILPGGTAYITDVGMTGPYDSVIGMKKENALKRFIYATPSRYEAADSDAKLAAVVLSIDKETGKSVSIERIFYPPFQ